MSALARSCAAEWFKIRSLRSSWWFASGALVLMVAVAALEADSTARDLRALGAEPGSVEAAASAVSATALVNVVLGTFGLLVMTGEYATRSIVVTLACTPSRTRLLLAKAVVTAAAVFAAGMLIAALGVAASVPLLGDYADFSAGEVAARILAIGANLALIGVLALGLGTLIRRSAGTLSVLVALLLIVPEGLVELAAVLDVQYLATAADYMPASAGERLMGGEPAFGLVLVAWAAAAILGGAFALRIRDA